MNRSIIRRISLIVVAVIFCLWGLATGFVFWVNREPADLKEKISDRKIEAYLSSWLDRNEAEISQLREDGKLDYVTGGPGLGPVKLVFDWSVLGFDPARAQIRVLGEPGKDWVAVFFGRTGRDGVVIARVNDFGLPPGRIVSINGRLAVYFNAKD